jgi:hypothetical protein
VASVNGSLETPNPQLSIVSLQTTPIKIMDLNLNIALHTNVQLYKHFRMTHHETILKQSWKAYSMLQMGALTTCKKHWKQK